MMGFFDQWRTLGTFERVDGARVRFVFRLTCANLVTLDDVRVAIESAGLTPGAIDAPSIIESLVSTWSVELPGVSGTAQDVRSRMAAAISILNASRTVPCMGYDAGEVQVFEGSSNPVGTVNAAVAGISTGVVLTLAAVAFVAWKVR